MKPDKLIKATPHPTRPEIFTTELRIKSPTGARQAKLEKLLSLLTREKKLDESIL
jgi:hypothetical protein